MEVHNTFAGPRRKEVQTKTPLVEIAGLEPAIFWPIFNCNLHGPAGCYSFALILDDESYKNLRIWDVPDALPVELYLHQKPLVGLEPTVIGWKPNGLPINQQRHLYSRFCPLHMRKGYILTNFKIQQPLRVICIT